MHKVAIVKCCDYDKRNIDVAISDLLELLGYDFTDFVKPGMTVFIKPNWVASRWRKSCTNEDTLWSVITHTAVIEGVADRVAAALGGKGKIIIGDNPSIDADFSELMEFSGVKRLEKKYNVQCEIVDLRPLVCKDLRDYGKKDKMVPQQGDTQGNIEINLGRESLLFGMDPTLFRGVFDERESTIASHTGETHLYTFARSLYDADVYISIPKMKTHQKVGATLNLKGLVGSVTDKNQLVHWRIGTPETGGDEYPNIDSFREAQKARVTHRGSHPGNDTIWRMVVDLYLGMQKRQRRYFSVVDGIIGGEGQGPFCPRAKQVNTLMAGESLLAVDIVAARLMGLDPSKISYLRHFLVSGRITFGDISVASRDYDAVSFFNSYLKYLDFDVPDQWRDIKINSGR